MNRTYKSYKTYRSYLFGARNFKHCFEELSPIMRKLPIQSPLCFCPRFGAWIAHCIVS
jgi:hypothetical protein